MPHEGHELVRAVLRYIGEDPDREGLRDTPARVVRAWRELFGGYGEDPAMTAFVETHDEMVVIRAIPFFSTCEHHLLPFFGTADIAYIPAGRLLGASKLVRVLDVYARRLQMQERLCEQVAAHLERAIKPRGVGVRIEAQHLCMIARGVRRLGASMTTCALRGALRVDAAARAEFLALARPTV